jgi:anti-sigma factor RsiW
MNCQEARILLMAYHDDELQPADTLRVEEHLRTCESCQAVDAEAKTLSQLLRDPELYVQPSEALKNRVKFAIRRQAGPASQPVLVWSAIAATLIAVLGIAAFLHRAVPPDVAPDLIASEVIDSHVRSLQPGHLIDVPSSDRHTVKPWFQGKLDFSPSVPDLSAQGWTLIGGRLDYLDRRPVAALVYQRGKHEINVYLWPAATGGIHAVEESAARGYQVLHGSNGSLNYWIVSDLNISELKEFAKAFE